MHYVKRVKNHWHVLFAGVYTFEFIGEFGSGQDAFSFCSYLNGGDAPGFGPNGWTDLDKITRPFTTDEMEGE